MRFQIQIRSWNRTSLFSWQSDGAGVSEVDETSPGARLLDGMTRRSLSIGRTGSVLAVVLLLGAALSIASDNFLATANLLDVGRQSSLLALMAIGVTVVLISGQIDLSIAAIFTLSGLVTAMVISGGHGIAAGSHAASVSASPPAC